MMDTPGACTIILHVQPWVVAAMGAILLRPSRPLASVG